MGYYFDYNNYINKMDIYKGRKLIAELWEVPNDIMEQTKLFNEFIEGRI